MVRILLAGCLMMGCACNLKLTQFRDVETQPVVKNRALFQLDLDLTPILEKEGVQPIQIASIQSFGRIYFTAEGFRNLYYLVPGGARQADFRMVKLRRAGVQPFQNVALDWAEKEQISFTWQDAEGAHTNVIDKKGKARSL